jgi:hypothetical protein
MRTHSRAAASVLTRADVLAVDVEEHRRLHAERLRHFEQGVDMTHVKFFTFPEMHEGRGWRRALRIA